MRRSRSSPNWPLSSRSDEHAIKCRAMHILSAAQMKAIDRRATERFGIPSIVLMENAALAVVDAIAGHYPDCDRAAIFCGLGANGGDGFAIARQLEQRGVVASVFIVGDRKKIRGDAA